MYRTNRPGTGAGRRFSGRSSEARPSSFHGGSQWRPRGQSRRKGQFIDPALFIHKPDLSSVESAQEYRPQHAFADFALHPAIKHNVSARGYTTPTPIQDQAIPAVLAGRDVIGVANTGTGKTAAFLLPLLNKVLGNRNEKVLIVAPTRELAMQIQDELRSFSLRLGIYSVLVIGGASIARQQMELRRGSNFVIGTPGRLKDLVTNRSLDLSGYQTIVLDEVDRMLDIGFIRDIEFLIAKLPTVRQSLFFTATITPKVEQILRVFVRDPVTVSVKTHTTAETVEQDIIRISDPSQKVEVLHELLKQEEFEKVIVFGRTKWGVEKLSAALERRGHRTASIHGNKTQGQRLRALQAFKRNQVDVLFATDVAARGIDVEGISHVINYDIPESYDDYVHRIGRTGRANARGKAITFVE